jgi:hypothetical protein
LESLTIGHRLIRRIKHIDLLRRASPLILTHPLLCFPVLFLVELRPILLPLFRVQFNPL